jgi:hypothetical protein
MIMRGTTPRALSAGGFLAVFGLAAILLPLYPTLARTEQSADGSKDLPPASGAKTTGVPAADATGFTGEVRWPSVTSPVGREETIEDAQDDVDLLRVQLDLRRAERREVQARLRQAQVDLQRYQRLAGNGGVSSDTVDHAQTEVVVQEARLAAKDAQIKEAELRLRQAGRRLARFQSRTVPPAKDSTSSVQRPTGSAVPQKPAMGGFGGGSSSAGGGGSFTGGLTTGAGTSFSGGLTTGAGTSFGGGMATGSRGIGGFSGMAGEGNPSTYEHRLAEVEKKLQTLMDEMKALHKERRREQRESDVKRP